MVPLLCVGQRCLLFNIIFLRIAAHQAQYETGGTRLIPVAHATAWLAHRLRQAVQGDGQQHDAQAAEAMRLLREFNLQVPQDVSIVSLEGSTLASQLNPALTCIEYPSERLAQEAVRLTLQVLGGHALPSAEQQKFTGRLVTRDSVQNR